ncbi:hypothetical protein CsSME_00025354 [Camellia sinensis var. sinensis]
MWKDVANSPFSLFLSLISNFKFIFIVYIHFQSLSLLAPSFAELSLSLYSLSSPTIATLQPWQQSSLSPMEPPSVTMIGGLFLSLLTMTMIMSLMTIESLSVFSPDSLLSTLCLLWTDLSSRQVEDRFFNIDFEDRFLGTDFEHRFFHTDF